MVSRKRHFLPKYLLFGMFLGDFRSSLKTFAILTLLCAAFTRPGTCMEPGKPVPIRVKGSFVIAAICKDGVIVASDSRGMLKDRQGRRIAYYDTNQKIFPIGKKLIAGTGYASINDPKISFLSALMSRFAQDPLSQVDIKQLPDAYFKYTRTVLARAGAESAAVQTLVFAGFGKGGPTLCLYQGESSHTTNCQFSGYLSSPKQRIVGLETVRGLSFAQAAHIMQQTIDDYAAAVEPGSVGGPVVIRTITISKAQWFENPLHWPNWDTFTDLAKDYKNDLVPFHLMPGISRAELDALIEEGAIWASLGQRSNSPKAGAPVIGSNHQGR